MSGLTAMGFASSSEVYKAAVKYFAATPSPGRLLVSCYPASESLSAALTAALDKNVPFYGVMVCNAAAPSVAEYLEFAAFVEGQAEPLMLFVPVNATGEGKLLNQLHAGGYKRTFAFYCAVMSDTAAVMGTAMGLELAHRGSAFALCYKTVPGILPVAAGLWRQHELWDGTY